MPEDAFCEADAKKNTCGGGGRGGGGGGGGNSNSSSSSSGHDDGDDDDDEEEHDDNNDHDVEEKGDPAVLPVMLDTVLRRSVGEGPTGAGFEAPEEESLERPLLARDGDDGSGCFGDDAPSSAAGAPPLPRPSRCAAWARRLRRVRAIRAVLPLAERAGMYLPSRGLRYVAIASVLFSMMALLVKLMPNLPIFELVLARALVQGPVGYAMLAGLRVRRPLGPLNKVPWLASRGFFGFVALASYFFGIQRLPLGEAVTLLFLSPVITAILAAIFLHEPWEKLDILGSCCSLIGVVFIARPVFIFGGGGDTGDAVSGGRALSIGVMLGSALSAALAFVSVRKIGAEVHPLVLVGYSSIACIIGSPIAALIFRMPFVKPEGLQWVLLPLMGLLATGGQTFVNRGLQLEEAAKATSVNYTQIVYGFVLQVLVLHAAVYFTDVIGSTLICSWIVVVFWKSARKRRRERAEGAAVPAATAADARAAELEMNEI